MNTFDNDDNNRLRARVDVLHQDIDKHIRNIAEFFQQGSDLNHRKKDEIGRASCRERV